MDTRSFVGYSLARTATGKKADCCDCAKSAAMGVWLELGVWLAMGVGVGLGVGVGVGVIEGPHPQWNRGHHKHVSDK